MRAKNCPNVATRKKLPSIEVGPTALARSMTSTLTYDSDLQSPASYRHDLLTAEVQGQRSVGSKDRVETNGQTDGWMEAIALPPSLMRSVLNFGNGALIENAGNSGFGNRRFRTSGGCVSNHYRVIDGCEFCRLCTNYKRLTGTKLKLSVRKRELHGPPRGCS